MAGKPELTVGVLALQGDVREHILTLTQLGVTTVEVRQPGQLTELDGLIIPGGESSVIDKLSRMFALNEPIRELIRGGFPVYGTCAGMIMLADRLEGAIVGQQTFGGLDITVQRNAFGSQLESFETQLQMPGVSAEPIHAAFIRAPLVVESGSGVEILGTLTDGSVTAVRQGNLLATSFHPEITGELALHRYFLNIIEANR